MTIVMVRYVILRRFLCDIPPKLSFWNTCISAWLTLQQGNLRGVQFPDSTIWKPVSNNNQSWDDIVHTMSDDHEPEFERNNGNDWSDINFDDKNNDASHDDAKNSNQVSKTNNNPPPHHTGHIKMVKSRPSDTCPDICSIIIQK